MGPRTPLRGPLYASIKVEESTWYVQDGLLTVQLLKRNRRGHYANGTSNADTFWMSVRLSFLFVSAKIRPCVSRIHSTTITHAAMKPWVQIEAILLDPKMGKDC